MADLWSREKQTRSVEWGLRSLLRRGFHGGCRGLDFVLHERLSTSQLVIERGPKKIQWELGRLRVPN